MPKHDQKHHPQGEGVKLVGNPEDIINMMVPDKAANQYVLNEMINEGPKHKQVLSALLLKRLYKLVITVEKATGESFTAQEGYEVQVKNETGLTGLPVMLPVNAGSKANLQEIADTAAEAPPHELLAYAICLQVIDWAIKVNSAKGVLSN